MSETYRTLNSYYREKFGRRVQRVTINAGLSCPNRGGCTYCLEGAAPKGRLPGISVEEQVRQGIEAGLKRYGSGTVFTAYFQSNTNTFAPVDELKKIFSEPLKFGEIIGLSVGTRPDCLDLSVMHLLDSFVGKYAEVWVELGLQSASDTTLQRINRGHTAEDFRSAARLAKEFPVKTAAHVIAGFPRETREDFLRSVKFAAEAGIDGIKIHPLHVIEGTKMAEEYKAAPFRLLEAEEYASWAADAIELLPERVVVMRLTAEAEPEKLIAPSYCVAEKKGAIKEMIVNELQRRGTRQGKKAG